MTSGDDRSSAAGGRPQHLMLPFHHPKCPHETFLRKFITQNVQLTEKWLTVGASVVMLALLWVLLRRRAKLRREREEDCCKKD
jgi:hypothetical protein